MKNLLTKIVHYLTDGQLLFLKGEYGMFLKGRVQRLVVFRSFRSGDFVIECGIHKMSEPIGTYRPLE